LGSYCISALDAIEINFAILTTKADDLSAFIRKRKLFMLAIWEMKVHSVDRDEDGKVFRIRYS
jgi:hypothetical protein